MVGYIVETVKDVYKDEKLITFLKEHGPILNERFGSRYDLRNFSLPLFLAKGGRMTLCRKGDEVFGVMLMSLGSPLWDYKVRYLRQEVLYTTRPKATHALFNEFIDYGRLNADDIITCINPLTNIKPSTVEKMGFEKLETTYRMRTNNVR